MTRTQVVACLLHLALVAGGGRVVRAQEPVLEFCTTRKGETSRSTFYRFAVFPAGEHYKAHWLVIGEVTIDGKTGPGIPSVRWVVGQLLQADIDALTREMRGLLRGRLAPSTVRRVTPRGPAAESWLRFTDRGETLQLHFDAGPFLEEDENDEPVTSTAPKNVQALLQLLLDSRSWMKNSSTMQQLPESITGYCFKGWAQPEANAVIERARRDRQASPRVPFQP